MRDTQGEKLELNVSIITIIRLHWPLGASCMLLCSRCASDQWTQQRLR